MPERRYTSRPHSPGQPVRSFSCSALDCAFATTTNKTMKQHEGAVHEVGKYPCPKCGTLFDTENGRRRHTRRGHKVRLVFDRCPIAERPNCRKFPSIYQMQLIHYLNAETTQAKSTIFFFQYGDQDPTLWKREPPSSMKHHKLAEPDPSHRARASHLRG